MIKTRKKPKVLTDTDKLSLIDDYAQGKLTVEQIATKYNTTENNVGLIVSRHWTQLTNMKESRSLIQPKSQGSLVSLKRIQNTEQINQKFLDQLSPDSAPSLTEPESIYAWIYVHSGDSVLALEEAKLNLGLIKGDRKHTAYSRALLVRSLYLNSKPNVAQYIKELRERRFIDQDITRAKVQSELLDQLTQLKQQPQLNRKEILRTIELLGKTVGAFVERLEISEVDPSKALDRLIELAKEAEITEITQTTEVTE